MKEMKKTVSVVPCSSYEQKEVDSAIETALEKIKFKVKPKLKILIKPNILAQNTPDQHSITHYTLVYSLCKYFKDKKCDVTLGESSAFYQGGYTKGSFKTSKIQDVADRLKIPVVLFEDEPIKTIGKKKLKFLDKLYLPKTLDEFDLIVDVPKLKTHMLMRFTGAVKNLYGLVPGGYKQILHLKTRNINDLAGIFLDIYENLKPKMLCVMDAVIGLDGGPASVTGKPTKVGYILASEDPFALDSVACQMIGYSPDDITTLTVGKKRKLFNPVNVKVIGTYKKTKFKKLLKGPIEDSDPNSIFITETHAWPKINRKCTLCGKCIDYCPVKALYIKNGKVKVDKNKCISCYTCVKQCPVDAIGLKLSFKGKLLCAFRRIVKS